MQKKIVRREMNNVSINGLANLHPLLQRVYASRSVKSEKELERELDVLLSYQLLTHIDKAVLLLSEALENKQLNKAGSL